MSAFNVVRFRCKPGREEEFVAMNRDDTEPRPKGSRRFILIKTGERAYCVIGEWDSMEDLAAARPAMIGRLDKIRDLLEDLGGGLGITDPVSGEAIVDIA